MPHKHYGVEGATSRPDESWRWESDHRALEQAAEILADRVRMRGVLRHHTKTVKAHAKMAGMLTSYRRGGSFGPNHRSRSSHSLY